MCELLALSSSAPDNVSRSLEAFARHGGLEGPHADGWGIAYYQGPDVQLFREPRAAATSGFIRFVRERACESDIVIAHIRKATRGDRTLANTQPFVREVAGRRHVFAHNGDLPRLLAEPLVSPRCRPVGTTDSELAFCLLLDATAALWYSPGGASLEARFAAVAAVAARLRRHGPANFLYADGEALFVHAHRRTQAPGIIEPPGLHLLQRRCEPDREVVLVSSVPLSDEAWEPLAEGELLALVGGRIARRLRVEDAT